VTYKVKWYEFFLGKVVSISIVKCFQLLEWFYILVSLIICSTGAFCQLHCCQ